MKMQQEQKTRLINFLEREKNSLLFAKGIKNKDFINYQKEGDIEYSIHWYCDNTCPMKSYDILKWALENLENVNCGIEENGTSGNVFEDLQNAYLITTYNSIYEELNNIKYLSFINNLIKYIQNGYLEELTPQEEENFKSSFNWWELDFDPYTTWEDLNNFDNLKESLEE